MRRNETTEEKIGCAEFYWAGKDQKLEVTFEVTRWDEPHSYGDTDAYEPMSETNILEYSVNGRDMSLENLEANVGKDRATALIDEALYNG